jgi:hypothetical protein
MDDIDIGLEEALERSLTRIDADRDASEDTSQNESVAGFRNIDEFIVDTQRDGVRCLTIRDRIRRFLQPNDLSVGEFAAVVDEGHGTDGATDISWAASGFFDLASVDFHLHSVLAGEAAEEGYFHVWNDGGCANDETFDAHELVGV